MKSLFYLIKESKVRVGTIVYLSPWTVESTPKFVMVEGMLKHDIRNCVLFEDQVGVMFPSDLQCTMLEDIWVNGYDSTLEENQDRYMNDFWKWCEDNCTSTLLRNGHVSFDFIA